MSDVAASGVRHKTDKVRVFSSFHKSHLEHVPIEIDKHQ